MKMSMYRALCGVGAGIILLGGLAGCGKKPEGGAGDVGPTSAVVSVNDSAPAVTGVEEDVEVVAEEKTTDDVSGKKGIWANGLGMYGTFPGSTVDRSFAEYAAKVAPTFFTGGYVDSDFGKRLYNNAWVVNADGSYSVLPDLDNYLSSSDYRNLFQYGDAYAGLEETVVGYHTGISVTTGAVTDDVIYAGLGDYLCVNGGEQDLSKPCYLGYVVMAEYASNGSFRGFTDSKDGVPYGLFDRAVTVGDLAVIIYGDSLGGDVSVIDNATGLIDVMNSEAYSELVNSAFTAVCADANYSFFGDYTTDTVLSCLDVDRILFRACVGDHASRITDASVVEVGIDAYLGGSSASAVEGLNHPELGQMSYDDLTQWVINHYNELDDSYWEDLDKLEEAREADSLAVSDYSELATKVVNLK